MKTLGLIDAEELNRACGGELIDLAPTVVLLGDYIDDDDGTMADVPDTYWLALEPRVRARLLNGCGLYLAGIHKKSHEATENGHVRMTYQDSNPNH